MPAVCPVIIVHGIQGSWLKDEYPVDYQDSILWTGILKRKFQALHLHPDDASVDSEPSRLIGPHQAVPLIYESLVEEIRDELSDSHPYVYMFSYDWRKDNRLSAQELSLFVERVLKIARVHEKARGKPRPSKVTLVGHSMGGLVIKWYATQILDDPARVSRKIDRIITIATPYKGSLKSVEALLPGARNLFGVENQKSMRHAARTLPGVYQLLPRWPEAVVDRATGLALDIYDETNWQRNIVEGLAERFPRDGATSYFQSMLRDAERFTRETSRPWPESLRRKVFTAVGVKTKTWWQVPVDRGQQNRFNFDDAVFGPDGDDKWGDGTVHSVSAILDEISATRRIEREDRLKDRVMGGHHANLPNHGSVQDWVLNALKLHPHFDHSFKSLE